MLLCYSFLCGGGGNTAAAPNVLQIFAVLSQLRTRKAFGYAASSGARCQELPAKAGSVFGYCLKSEQFLIIMKMFTFSWCWKSKISIMLRNRYSFTELKLGACEVDFWHVKFQREKCNFFLELKANRCQNSSRRRDSGQRPFLLKIYIIPSIF